MDNLEPKALWSYFDQICKIPRPSKHEEKIVDFVKNFGLQHGLETIADEVGNVLIRKPATAGRENTPSLAFQSHMDMVAEKNSDVEHDFLADPIQTYVDGDWLKARGTTLGADDGIGVAAQLALIADNTIEHGPLEFLFTVDEETGLTGANALKPGMLKSKQLVNLDSEDDGDFCIGCAGGVDTKGYFQYKTVSPSKNMQFYKVQVTGLIGGHSGEDINKNRANAIVLLARVLYMVGKESQFDMEISEIAGGNLHNAIPREAHAVVGFTADGSMKFEKRFDEAISQICAEYSSEPDMRITAEGVECPKSVLVKPDGTLMASRLVQMLMAFPHGVQGMSQDIEGLVETSTNLASVKMDSENNEIVVGTSQRSSVESKKTEVKNRVEALLMVAGANRVTHNDGYPGWKPNVNSYIKDVLVESYTELFGVTPKVRAIHAGLECGLFFEKYPDLDMISVGPTIIGVHSPAERVQISTVQKFWKMLLDVVARVK